MQSVQAAFCRVAQRRWLLAFQRAQSPLALKCVRQSRSDDRAESGEDRRRRPESIPSGVAAREPSGGVAIAARRNTTVAATATEGAASSGAVASARPTPPIASHPGMRSAAIAPPSGTAICRTPSANARLSGGYARNRAQRRRSERRPSRLPRPGAPRTTAASSAQLPRSRDQELRALFRRTSPAARQRGRGQWPPR